MMQCMGDFVLGADPGGAGNGGSFGWALVEWVPGTAPPSETRATYSGVATHAGAAWKAARLSLREGDRIVGVGIDGPLGYDDSWDRRVDRLIWESLRTPGASRTPITQNSLQGACLVQALMFGHLALEGGQDAISESFPRAVRAFSPRPLRVRCSECDDPDAQCHRCDAALSALSGWAMVCARSGSATPGWVNWHELELASQPVRPSWMVIPDHDYWLPVP